jgi:plastocyanin
MKIKIYLFMLAVTVAVRGSPAVADAVTILQQGKQFSQDSVTVRIGDTLVFQNAEKDISHNVYSISPGNEFELKTQKPGTRTPIVIDTKGHHEGEMLVECAIHPKMKLKVKIVK